ncbi:LytR/AlgR family response regulator transcription factor [Spirosoma agri]|uniref:LytTR family transcriptional regulator n=1 Tax=Spirosoma agri TaxID=1987381 RepID=A0A6M0IKH0_9BACT|nr:LytTR family DNA-binding domain-containing protein [Spirosoma agri]NEU68377.1 LytTR family transcriptional regulator [Spirosoma agri]
MKPSFAAGVRQKVEISSIIAITGDVNYSYVYLANGQCQFHSRTLKWLQDRYPSLLRIHKSYLINLNHVTHYSLSRGRSPHGYVVMENDLKLSVSRRNVELVRELLNKTPGRAQLISVN